MPSMPPPPLHFHALSTLVLVLSVVMALLSSFLFPPFFGGLETKASWLGGCLSDGVEGVSSIWKEKRTTALESTLGNGKVTWRLRCLQGGQEMVLEINIEEDGAAAASLPRDPVGEKLREIR